MPFPARLAAPVVALLLLPPLAVASEHPLDVRRSGPPAAVPDDVRAARGKGEGLPPGATVDADRRTGGLRQVRASGTPLTGPSSADPAAIALGWAREHLDLLGIAAADLDALALRARHTDPLGITHLRWVQTAGGLESFDTGLEAHVDARGRLLAVQGAPVRGLRAPAGNPEVTAGEALAAADSGTRLPPASAGGTGPQQATTFAGGEQARLALLAGTRGVRRAWRVTDDEHETVVDATSGDVLVRRELVHDADADGFPSDPDAGPMLTQALPADWISDSAGATRLAGRFARAYADLDDNDAPSAGEEVAAGPGGHWRFGLNPVAGTSCPPSGCTWDGVTRASAAPNRPQSATNAFLLVNEFHDWLKAAPVGFDAASGGFEDNDRVVVEVQDGGGLNNANMWTPPDGTSPRMQMYLWTSHRVDSAHDASVVFHEYGHGLTNRLVVTPGGGGALSGEQARSMGEAWSDWYALDALVARGLTPDTAAADLRVGAYVSPGGIRSMPTDCPVGGAPYPCAAKGLTYGDMRTRTVPHSAGEVWAQTLWDIRKALGSVPAREIVTGGLRLAPDDPDVLDARDAILQADAGRNEDALWAIFAARGMGQSARSASSAGAVNGITEAFDLPGGLQHAGTVVGEAPDDSDADGVLEPGEGADVTTTLANGGAAAVTGATTTITTTDPALTVQRGAATWPVVGAGAQHAVAPLRARLAESAACHTTATLSLTILDEAGQRTVPVPVRIGPSGAEGFPGPGSAVRTAIPDGDPAGVSIPLTVTGEGTVDDLEVRLEELRHSWVGDLVVTLRHDGVAVRLLDRMGRTTSGWGNGGDDLVDVVLDDEATAALEDAPEAAAPFTGRWRPSQSLAAFDGLPLEGTWTLEISDHEPYDAGTVERWGLGTSERPCRSVRVAPPAPPAVAPPPIPVPELPPVVAPTVAEPVPAAPPAAAAPRAPAPAASVQPRPPLLVRSLPRAVRRRNGRVRLSFRAPEGTRGTAELWAGRRRIGRSRWTSRADGRVVTSVRVRRATRHRRAVLVVRAGETRVRRTVALRAR